jgi:two-component system, OmpR family, response regulator QseB
MRILLVEDDPQLGDGLTIGLRQGGFAVDWVKTGTDADLALLAEPYSLVVLDLGLPKLSGMDLLRRVRGRGQDVPVLILTARDKVADKIDGLDGGADDFLVKPVDLDELAARIRALLRRAAGRAMPIIRHDSLTLNPASREVMLNDNPIELSGREFALLHVLLENIGRVMTRAQLESAIYGWRDEPDSNALEVHVHHLRRKLGSEFIRTLRGVGYMIPK